MNVITIETVKPYDLMSVIFLINQALDTKVIGSTTIVLYNILSSKGVSTILNDIYSLVNFT